LRDEWAAGDLVPARHDEHGVRARDCHGVRRLHARVGRTLVSSAPGARGRAPGAGRRRGAPPRVRAHLARALACSGATAGVACICARRAWGCCPRLVHARCGRHASRVLVGGCLALFMQGGPPRLAGARDNALHARGSRHRCVSPPEGVAGCARGPQRAPGRRRARGPPRARRPARRRHRPGTRR